MTLEEFEALPIAKSWEVLFHNEDDAAIVADRDGFAWSVGWINGIRYRKPFGTLFGVPINFGTDKSQ